MVRNVSNVCAFDAQARYGVVRDEVGCIYSDEAYLMSPDSIEDMTFRDHMVLVYKDVRPLQVIAKEQAM